MKKYLSALPPAIFLALPLMVLPASAAQPVKPADVRSFDVGGVKTGMSVAQARAAMQKNFGVPAEKITASESAPYQVATRITGSRQVMYLVYEDNGTRMQVTFEPCVPYDKSNPMAAALISYEILWTKGNENAMKKAALKKYGPVSAGGMYPLWCDKTLPRTGMGCEPDWARLEATIIKLEMSGPAWQNARIRYMDQQIATRPKI